MDTLIYHVLDQNGCMWDWTIHHQRAALAHCYFQRASQCAMKGEELFFDGCLGTPRRCWGNAHLRIRLISLCSTQPCTPDSLTLLTDRWMCG